MTNSSIEPTGADQPNIMVPKTVEADLFLSSRAVDAAAGALLDFSGIADPSLSVESQDGILPVDDILVEDDVVGKGLFEKSMVEMLTAEKTPGDLKNYFLAMLVGREGTDPAEAKYARNLLLEAKKHSEAQRLIKNAADSSRILEGHAVAKVGSAAALETDYKSMIEREIDEYKQVFKAFNSGRFRDRDLIDAHERVQAKLKVQNNGHTTLSGVASTIAADADKLVREIEDDEHKSLSDTNRLSSQVELSDDPEAPMQKEMINTLGFEFAENVAAQLLSSFSEGGHDEETVAKVVDKLYGPKSLEQKKAIVTKIKDSLDKQSKDWKRANQSILNIFAVATKDTELLTNRNSNFDELQKARPQDRRLEDNKNANIELFRRVADKFSDSMRLVRVARDGSRAEALDNEHLAKQKQHYIYRA
jgi:hypothetical protein